MACCVIPALKSRASDVKHTQGEAFVSRLRPWRGNMEHDAWTELPDGPRQLSPTKSPNTVPMTSSAGPGLQRIGYCRHDRFFLSAFITSSFVLVSEVLSWVRLRARVKEMLELLVSPSHKWEEQTLQQLMI